MWIRFLFHSKDVRSEKSMIWNRFFFDPIASSSLSASPPLFRPAMAVSRSRIGIFAFLPSHRAREDLPENPWHGSQGMRWDRCEGSRKMQSFLSWSFETEESSLLLGVCMNFLALSPSLSFSLAYFSCHCTVLPRLYLLSDRETDSRKREGMENFHRKFGHSGYEKDTPRSINSLHKDCVLRNGALLPGKILPFGRRSLFFSNLCETRDPMGITIPS